MAKMSDTEFMPDSATVVWRGETITDPATAGLVRHLQMMVDLRKHHMGEHSLSRPPADFVYAGMEDLLLQHGRLWTPQPLPNQYRWRTIKFCFDNCYKLAKQSRGHLRYVEGIAQGIIPMHHAWCVTPDGKVVDPTWRNHNEDTNRAYLGVVLPVARVKAVRDTTSGCSVLDDWELKHKILREPFTEVQDVSV